MSHVHCFELLTKEKTEALFMCECGTSRIAPIDEAGQLTFWNHWGIGPKTPSGDEDGSSGRGSNGN